MTGVLASVTEPLEIIRDKHIGHLGSWVEHATGRIGWRCASPSCPGYNRVVEFRDQPPAAADAGSTSTSKTRGIPKLGDPDACGIHTGEWADSCGRCRADVIGIDPEQEREVTRPAGAPPSPEYLAARAALREKSTR